MSNIWTLLSFPSQKHSNSTVIYIIQSEMLESFNDW